jgi:2-dehydropantoate 2-reductase
MSLPKDAPHIVIAGAGSIGCFIGGMLAAGGRRVTLLARPRIAAEIRSHGLTLTDLDGMAINIGTDDLQVTEDASCLQEADLVLVTVKSRDTAAIGKLIDIHAPADATVISLQNGIGNAQVLRAALPGRDLRAGMVPFNVVPMGQGCYHRAVEGDIVIEAGPHSLAQVLAVSGMDCRESGDIVNIQWGKFLVNLTNALNALSGLPLYQQLQDRQWRRLMADQWAEALRILRAQGIRPVSSTPLPVLLIPWVLRLPTGLFTRIASRMLHIDPQARTSMSYDLMEGRPTEIDALQGEVLRRAAALGLAAPINAMVVDVMQTAERAGEGLPDLSPKALRAELTAGR